MGQKYKSYRDALNKMNLEDLDEQRENLCLTFAQRTSRHPTMKKMFPLNKKSVGMSKRWQNSDNKKTRKCVRLTKDINDLHKKKLFALHRGTRN